MLVAAALLPQSTVAGLAGYDMLTDCKPSVTPVVPRTVTVSGQSAGASIAIQHMVAFSTAVEGAAIAAGSPCNVRGVELCPCAQRPAPTHAPSSAVRILAARRWMWCAVDALVDVLLRRSRRERVGASSGLEHGRKTWMPLDVAS
jgi:hypothetical protein